MRDERRPSQAAENRPALIRRVPEGVADGAEPGLLGAPDTLDRLLGLLEAAARGQASAARPAGTQARRNRPRVGDSSVQLLRPHESETGRRANQRPGSQKRLTSAWAASRLYRAAARAFSASRSIADASACSAFRHRESAF